MNEVLKRAQEALQEEIKEYNIPEYTPLAYGFWLYAFKWTGYSYANATSYFEHIYRHIDTDTYYYLDTYKKIEFDPKHDTFLDVFDSDLISVEFDFTKFIEAKTYTEMVPALKFVPRPPKPRTCKCCAPTTTEEE